DAGEEALAGVRRAHPAGPLVRVERQRVSRELLAPEIAIESFEEVARFPHLRVGDLRVAELLAEARDAQARGVHVSLQLAERDRPAGDRAVRVEDGIRRILPTLLHGPIPRSAAVLDVAVLL